MIVRHLHTINLFWIWCAHRRTSWPA